MISEKVSDIKAGGMVIDEWEFGCDGSLHICLTMRGASDKEYSVIADIQSICED